MFAHLHDLLSVCERVSLRPRNTGDDSEAESAAEHRAQKGRGEGEGHERETTKGKYMGETAEEEGNLTDRRVGDWTMRSDAACVSRRC